MATGKLIGREGAGDAASEGRAVSPARPSDGLPVRTRRRGRPRWGCRCSMTCWWFPVTVPPVVAAWPETSGSALTLAGESPVTSLVRAQSASWPDTSRSALTLAGESPVTPLVRAQSASWSTAVGLPFSMTCWWLGTTAWAAWSTAVGLPCSMTWSWLPVTTASPSGRKARTASTTAATAPPRIRSHTGLHPRCASGGRDVGSVASVVSRGSWTSMRSSVSAMTAPSCRAAECSCCRTRRWRRAGGGGAAPVWQVRGSRDQAAGHRS